MTQEQINEIVEEYRRCKNLINDKTLPRINRKFYSGKISGIKATLEVVGVYVEEVALLL
ncbi:hypothetical protein [Lysinibacillus sp. TE18511]